MKKLFYMIVLHFVIIVSGAFADTNLWTCVDLTLTPTNNLDYASARLREQNKMVFLLRRERYSAQDVPLATNLWNRLAVLHGDLREKRTDFMPPVWRSFGAVTNQTDLQELVAQNIAANKLRTYQSQRYDLEGRIEIVLSHVAASEALASFPLDERNAIVSNIVETARLTAEESAALGLTNIVEQTGEP